MLLFWKTLILDNKKVNSKVFNRNVSMKLWEHLFNVICWKVCACSTVHQYSSLILKCLQHMIGGDCFWHLATTPLFITHHWEIYLDARFVLPDIRSNVLMHIKSSQKLGNSEERERRDSRHRKKHNDINNTEKLYAVQSFQKVYSLFWKQPVCKCFFSSGVRYMERKKGLSQVVQGTWMI